MLDLKFDLSAFEHQARQVGAALDQLPFAISLALNNAAKATREKLANETWPSHVTVRNKGFAKFALGIEFATKTNLRVQINDKRAEGRGNLALHAKGGTKQSKKLLAIPSQNVRRTSKGVAANQRPRALAKAIRKGDQIYQVTGGKKRRNQKLRLMYTLKPSARMKKDVPFNEDFQRLMRAEMINTIPAALKRAMATRRR